MKFVLIRPEANAFWLINSTVRKAIGDVAVERLQRFGTNGTMILGYGSCSMNQLVSVVGWCLFLMLTPAVWGQAVELADDAVVDSLGVAGPGALAEPKGINAGFTDPAMDVATWVDRFEGESREVYASRKAVVEALRIGAETRVADVGTGTGFFARLMAPLADWVFAVDISPRFIEHNRDLIADKEIANMTALLCTERAIGLPDRSVDLVFVCDTYHHFEHYEATLASIYRALRSGGRLAVIDFERIPGVSREWIMGHVRAGKETVQDEIRAAGFELVREVQVPQFEENYFLIFEKVE